jgi:hypothetical protein
VVFPEPQLKFVNGADGTWEVSYIATDNSIAIKLALSRKQAAGLIGELSASPNVNLDGTIYVSIDTDVLELPIGKAVTIDEFVYQAVQPDMLEDEPEAANMLAEFRTRLLKSLEHVEKAIASLPKP